MTTTIVSIIIVYIIVAFIIKVLINVFDEWLPEDMANIDWVFSIFWLVSIPLFLITVVIVSIGNFADWLAEKIKDMLEW